MTLGLFLVTAAVALIWSGLKNKDLREAIPLFFTGKNPDNAGPISEPLPSDEPVSGESGRGAQLGGSNVWNRLTVAAYGKQLERAFNVNIISHCRTGATTSTGNRSLHADCRALDFRGSRSAEEKLARWARSQGAFQEVIYTHATTPGISDSIIAMHDGRRGVRHVHIGFPPSGRVPIVPQGALTGFAGIPGV